MPYTPQPQDNHLLAALSPDVQKRLFPHMQLVTLKLGSILFEYQSPMPYVYFPTDSIISLQYLLENGESTALSVVGNEGLLGVNLFLAEESAPSWSVVQSAGFAYRIPSTKVREEFRRHGELMLLMLRYTQAFITQVSQTAVCNRHHTVLQQFCRWLLISIDRLPHTHLTMTHDFIASMLGIRRESVSRAANYLQDQQAITNSRGKIDIVDRFKLEALVCECYRAVKTQTSLLLHYLPQLEVQTDGNTTLAPEEQLSNVARKV